MTGRKTVIRGGLVLDAEGPAALQDLLIEDGRILAIENPGFEVSDDAEIVSAADRMLIPGLISAHTHSHGALNRGAVEDRVSLEMFLTGAGASPRSRGVHDKYLSAALSAAEMIRKGCTACFDLTVEFPAPSREGISAVARAYRDAGMRAVIAPGATRPAGCAAGRSAVRLCASWCCAHRANDLGLPRYPGELGVRPPLDSSRARPDDPAALLRWVPDRLRTSLERI